MEKVVSDCENTNIFSCKGILKRKKYLIFVISLILINTFVRGLERKLAYSDSYSFFIGMYSVIWILLIVASIMSTIKRLRDIGWWPWLAVFSVIPLWMLFLSFFPSKTVEKKDNRVFLSKLKDFLSNAIIIILVIGYFGFGLLQGVAIFSGIYDYTGSVFWAFVLSAIVTYIPLLGTVAGIYGACNYWDWPLWGAILLFTSHLIFAFIFFCLQGFIERIECKNISD